jgi:hypothetical protein
MKQVRMRFKRNGQVEIDPTGFVGEACKTATAPFEQLLGKQVDTEDKPERYQEVRPEVGA